MWTEDEEFRGKTMKELESDVIVVAAGPSGLAAALTAAQGGAQRTEEEVVVDPDHVEVVVLVLGDLARQQPAWGRAAGSDRLHHAEAPLSVGGDERDRGVELVGHGEIRMAVLSALGGEEVPGDHVAGLCPHVDGG